MVLRNDDKPADSTGLASANDLVGVELRGVQHRGVFVAKAPFAVGIGVQPPMDDADYLRPVRKPRRKRRARKRPRQSDTADGHRRREN